MNILKYWQKSFSNWSRVKDSSHNWVGHYSVTCWSGLCELPYLDPYLCLFELTVPFCYYLGISVVVFLSFYPCCLALNLLFLIIKTYKASSCVLLAPATKNPLRKEKKEKKELQAVVRALKVGCTPKRATIIGTTV